jgi:deaminated glutathione amidase
MCHRDIDHCTDPPSMVQCVPFNPKPRGITPVKLIVATCQFAVDADIRRNTATIIRQMRTAKSKGAHVAHFPETALSGYAGRELASTDEIDWELLEASTRSVMTEAAKLGLWVITGSTHRLSRGHKPHNSLYIIDAKGALVDRYDKRFCTGDATGSIGDLKHYSPGDHFALFTIRGICCGAQICHDFRYQELYREYKRRGVQVMFHSYHNGHVTKDALEKSGNIHGVIVPPTMQTYAANNAMWISANNTSARESSWPSFFVLPNGVIAGRLARNRAGVIVSEVDPRREYYDASKEWRDRAMAGVFNSGTLVDDPRSRERRKL